MQTAEPGCSFHALEATDASAIRRELKARGFEVEGDGAATLTLSRDGVVFDLREVALSASLVPPALPHACSMRQARQRWVLTPLDLDRALGETNALIDAQLVLRTLATGVLHVSWNDAVQPPDDWGVAAATPGKLWSAALKRDVAPLMNGSGFRKKGQCFERRLGTVDQRLAFRKSGTRYHLELGWSVDEARALGGGTSPVVIAGQSVMFSAPVVDAPIETWTVTPDTRLDHLAADLGAELGRLVAALDRIDGPNGMLANVDLSAGFRKLDRARLKLVVGDEPGADADVRAVAEEFADRPAVTLEGLRAEVRGLPDDGDSPP